MHNTLCAKEHKRTLGAFVLVFLEAKIKSTCISHNSLSIFPIQQCIIKQLLNSVICDICNNQGLSKCNQLRPCLFRISQKRHLSITYICIHGKKIFD